MCSLLFSVSFELPFKRPIPDLCGGPAYSCLASLCFLHFSFLLIGASWTEVLVSAEVQTLTNTFSTFGLFMCLSFLDYLLISLSWILQVPPRDMSADYYPYLH